MLDGHVLLRLAWGLLWALVAAPSAEALDTLYLVRHADKAEFWPADRALNAFQPLSRAGGERAELLAEHLSAAGVAAIYTSSTTRTLATGMPLAEATGVPIGADDRSIARPRMAAFVADLEARHSEDAAVLLVGHSNTVPLLLIELGAEEICFERLDIHDHDGELLIHGYEGLWRIDLAKRGCAGIERHVVALEPSTDGGE